MTTIQELTNKAIEQGWLILRDGKIDHTSFATFEGDCDCNKCKTLTAIYNAWVDGQI